MGKKMFYTAKNEKFDNNQGALIVEEVGPVVKTAANEKHLRLTKKKAFILNHLWQIIFIHLVQHG